MSGSSVSSLVGFDFDSLPPILQEYILNQPARPPPPGVTPNFVDPPNQNHTAGAVVFLGIALVTICGLLRVYTRVFVTRTVKIEDYLGLAAFVFYVGLMWGIISLMIKVGFFVDQYNVQVRTFLFAAKVVYAYPSIYSATMLLAKNAILLEWGNIFVPAGTRNWFFWSTRVLIVANTLIYLAAILAGTFLCKPVRKSWDFFVPGTCLDRQSVHGSVVCFNLAVDLFILVLPQKVIWSLNMTLSRKIGVSFIFSLGLMALACAGGHAYSNLIGMGYYGWNTTQTVSSIFLWSFSEVSCVLLVLYVPAASKAFRIKEGSFLARLVSSLRSWGGLLSTAGKRSVGWGSKDSLSEKAGAVQRTWPAHIDTQNEASWPRTRLGTPNSGEWGPYYRNPLEAGQNGHDTGSQAKLELVHSKGTGGSGPEPVSEVWAPGVIKTTEIHQNVVDSAAGGPLDSVIQRQHPWMQQKSRWPLP
ncbi:hypothetical protein B0T24DRAFT_626160 [Lasiosphaeria ovina]|uniref:Rhodopsin domain-containing protein n=1 Tax=Lasiosphaeria ovina TaxID=92902 RepID=A0AAE0KCR5_9PEZI|nr:hypothetical protein B0T24DRAFT_626160 [Lasiosphaeria ovina]